MIELTATPFDPATALKAFEESVIGAGGIVSFTGLVRPGSPDNPVLELHLQAYSPMTERHIAQAVSKANTRWELEGTAIIHRIGDMAPNDPIVFVAAAALHRRDAFEATDFLMDYLKTEAVFWKKETRQRGETWIEPRSQDYDDAKRWASIHKEIA